MKELQIFKDKAAGIDVGSESLHTSIAGDSPKVFGAMTADLYALRDYLVANGGRQVQNVSGCKTDMTDCRWLATLHTHGLLHAGFVPEADIRRLQDYMRLRTGTNQHGGLACAAHVKALEMAVT